MSHFEVVQPYALSYSADSVRLMTIGEAYFLHAGVVDKDEVP